MTAFAFPNLEGGAAGSDISLPGGKIIQRISAAGLSDSIKPSRMADADLELVTRSQTGDPAAFEELVRQHQRMIHALTFRMTGSLADAEDLAQDAFIRAYEQIGTFHGKARFSTWLYRIAMNTCLNWRQSEARRCRLHADCADEFSTRHQGGENSAAKRGENEYVQAALLKLPAKQRAAIVLTIYDGLNHAEAAEILGCSETTVSWRVFTAKRKLKKSLAIRRGEFCHPIENAEPGAAVAPNEP